MLLDLYKDIYGWCRTFWSAAGGPLRFPSCWRCSAAAYGGTAAGYCTTHATPALLHSCSLPGETLSQLPDALLPLPRYALSSRAFYLPAFPTAAGTAAAPFALLLQDGRFGQYGFPPSLLPLVDVMLCVWLDSQPGRRFFITYPLPPWYAVTPFFRSWTFRIVDIPAFVPGLCPTPNPVILVLFRLSAVFLPTRHYLLPTLPSPCPLDLAVPTDCFLRPSGRFWVGLCAYATAGWRVLLRVVCWLPRRFLLVKTRFPFTLFTTYWFFHFGWTGGTLRPASVTLRYTLRF